MARFNEETPDDPNVKYFSYGAQFEPTWSNVFRIPWGVVYEHEGANDGLVSVASAKWGEYKATLQNVNHLDLVGWVGKVRYGWAEWIGKKIKFKPVSFYCAVAEVSYVPRGGGAGRGLGGKKWELTWTLVGGRCWLRTTSRFNKTDKGSDCEPRLFLGSEATDASQPALSQLHPRGRPERRHAEPAGCRRRGHRPRGHRGRTRAGSHRRCNRIRMWARSRSVLLPARGHRK